MNPTVMTHVEIDLGAIAHNVRELRRITAPSARLMAVVKADGYGHGAFQVAETALENGADVLGVARLEEALKLRKAGLAAPMLIFGVTDPGQTAALIQSELIQTVYSYEQALAFDTAAAAVGKPLAIHLKVDTGMGRLGLLADALRISPTGKRLSGQAVREVETIAVCRHLHLAGIFTHFASSDSQDKRFANQQFEAFELFCEQLQMAGIEIPTRHAANSGAIIDLPETHLDMVRAGISLYGLYPSAEVQTDRIDLRPAMTMKSRIVQLKSVSAGFSVSYGSTWQAPAPTRIATLPVGYADGLRRTLSNQGKMLVRGQPAPIVGRVCMDLTMLDVGHISGVQTGDEVVIFGSQKDRRLSVDEMAAQLDTINYEIVTGITQRVPRVYK